MFGWLLWAAVGSTATLNAYGWPPIVSTLAGSCFCLAWIVLNVSTQQLVRSFLGGCTDIFFRQIVVVGAHKLNETDGPLLLCIAPHSNQFIDPMIVLKTFRRPIGFLCAAKSMRYKRDLGDLVAFFARAVEAVPVERPQDLAFRGDGKVVVPRDDDGSESDPVPSRRDDDDGAASSGGAQRTKRYVVHGRGTAFARQAAKGAQLLIAEGRDKGAVARIADVVSDEMLEVSSPGFERPDGSRLSTTTTTAGGDAPANGEGLAYKIIPKLDQRQMYAAVYDRLNESGVVGIFPEGGSHDRATLLPLKPGIAVMALGACEKFGEELRSKLRIVAVGLNYFSGHRFRSRVFVDYGQPFEVPSELVEQYASGDRRGAGDALMQLTLTAVKAVTVQAPNHETQEVLYMLRRLYVADDRKLSLDQKVAITRGFASAFEGDKDRAEVKALLARVAAYNVTLKQWKVHDRRVALGGADESVVDRVDAIAMLSVRCVVLVFYAAALVPGLLLASPLLSLAEIISSRKAKAAVAGSRVKLEGRDVVATWKVLVAMIVTPVLHFVYTALIYLRFAYRHAVAYFFFMPFVSATSILASESFIDVARSVGPLYMLIFNREAGAQLRADRRRLQRDVRDTAQRLGWTDIIHKSASRADIAGGGLAGLPDLAPPPSPLGETTTTTTRSAA